MKRLRTSYTRTDQQLLQQERKVRFIYPASKLDSVTSGKKHNHNFNYYTG